MKILFATTMLPQQKVTGSEVASTAFVEAIRAAGHDVTVVGYRRAGAKFQPEPGTVNVADRPIESRDAGIHGAWWLLQSLASGRAYSVTKYRSDPYMRRVVDQLQHAPDALVIDHAQMGWLTDVIGGEVAVAFIAHNVEHQLYADAVPRARHALRWLNRRESRLIERDERRLARRARRVWALSQDDAQGLAGLGARATKVVALPPGVSGPVMRDATQDVGLLGTWTWELNEAGLNWLLDEVHPLLGNDVSVCIAGAGSERHAEESRPSVRCVGRVEDAAAFLGSSRVIAIPAVATAGVQIKTLDAIATGVPVVATSVALRGLDDVPSSVVVADDPRDFAGALRAAVEAPTAREAAAHEAGIWAEERRRRFQNEIANELERLVAPEGAQALPA